MRTTSFVNAEKMLAYQRNYGSSQLAIKLARSINPGYIHCTDPLPIDNPLDNLLTTSELRQALSIFGVNNEEFALFGRNSNFDSNTKRIRFLADCLNSGNLPLLFVGEGLIGHWVIVWGYEGGGFLVFDTSHFAEKDRDEKGLSRHSADWLIERSGCTTKLQRFYNLVGKVWPRLKILPGTVVVAYKS